MDFQTDKCTHSQVIVIGDEPGQCQVCGAYVVTPAADDHRADINGNRVMWVEVSNVR